MDRQKIWTVWYRGPGGYDYDFCGAFTTRESAEASVDNPAEYDFEETWLYHRRKSADETALVYDDPVETPISGDGHFFAEAETGTWHIMYPGERLPLCGSPTVLTGKRVPGSAGIPDRCCHTCRRSRRLKDDGVTLERYVPGGSRAVCLECGTQLPEFSYHHHVKLIPEDGDRR